MQRARQLARWRSKQQGKSSVWFSQNEALADITWVIAFVYFWTLAVEKLHRLYEQKQTALEWAAALDDYLTRWKRWTTAGCYCR
jgi:hypothetical protein